MMRFLLGGTVMLAAAPAWAQHTAHSQPPTEASQPVQEAPASSTGAAPDEMPMMGDMENPAAEPAAAPGPPVTTLHNLEPQPGWPSPTADDGNYSFVLLDLLEYRESAGPGSFRWDAFGWFGGDYERLWVKTEGVQSTRARDGGDAEVQLLYGRLISPYFDLQVGGRLASRWGRGPDRMRAYAAIGLQGLSPYRFEIEPTLFISTKGQISGRLTGSYDQLLTQRLILQPRLEASFALQKDEAFAIGSGLTDAEIGLRLRYEIRREFAPYVGVAHRRSFGSTSRLLRAEGESTRQTMIVAGFRIWF